MDPNKEKFIRHKNLKKKFRPKNVATKNVKKSSESKEKVFSNQSDEESENELKQPIPESGWFPEYDSTSSSDFEDITTCDKNWFDKELDNIQLNKTLVNLNKNETDESVKIKLSSGAPIEKNTLASGSKISVNSIKINIKTKEKSKILDDEEELEFLLSLKEPVHSVPVVVKTNIENERKLNVSTQSPQEQKPIKSIDLEKWLDSVLDDQ